MKQAFLQIIVDEEVIDVSQFLEDRFGESKIPQIQRFTRILFGVICSQFLLAVTKIPLK